MTITVYGEMGKDWLIRSGEEVDWRWGGAGLYAAISAVNQGFKANLLTIYGPELSSYDFAYWNEFGIDMKYAKKFGYFTLPKYIITGFGQHGKKRSYPTLDSRLEALDYNPVLPDDTEALIVFPINHSLPKSLLEAAKEQGIPIYLDPKPNGMSISDAKKYISFATCLLVNEEEAKKLTDRDDIYMAINCLKSIGIPQIVIKQGFRGCLVINGDDEQRRVNAFKSKPKCSVGSGDVFAGALASSYLQSNDFLGSVKLANCSAANFIEQYESETKFSQQFILDDMDIREQITVPDVSEKSIYLAGPFFSQQELQWVKQVCNILEESGFPVYSPSRENGIITHTTTQEERKQIFDKDIELLERSSAVVLLVDNNDSGASFEAGFAYKEGIPIFALKTSKDPLNNMLQYGCSEISSSTDELIEALYGHFRE
ncbi:MAG TPA: PfkB family carbohydrate kinase [Patescibacteria group bacterium]|nr:PfkB family carbohydrate kinase [Patescibacteria group bacterium]